MGDDPLPTNTEVVAALPTVEELAKILQWL